MSFHLVEHVALKFMLGFSIIFVSCEKYDDPMLRNGSLKVVVRADKSFYVRYSIDESNDGILQFDYYSGYGFRNNSIATKSFHVGRNTESDRAILKQAKYHNCNDVQSPMFTQNLGPLFSNHGYSTPRVTIPRHGLTTSDIGSEWVDQNGYHYTIGMIEGRDVFLLPIIYSTGIAGEEKRQWKWYSLPYPTVITQVGGTGRELVVAESSRWDYQVSLLKNVSVTINGEDVEEGTYYCDKVNLICEQIGYNPLFIRSWWPTPEYNDIMLKFHRHFTISGGRGFLSVTTNTELENCYPYPLFHYIDVAPQFPFTIGDYKPYIYIPKLKKITTDIDFRKEFISVDENHVSVHYFRNAEDLDDVDNMPDRAYCYLKNDEGTILYGCAGGHSLVRGMSMTSIRNNYIALDKEVGIWNPRAGNKHYNNVLVTTNERENMLPDKFTGEFEGFMCWYKPMNGIHCFYHLTKDGYVVYIHTNKAIRDGDAVVPAFMDNLKVDSIVEKTKGIILHSDVVVDGKLSFTSDNSEVEYNYLVCLLK